MDPKNLLELLVSSIVQNKSNVFVQRTDDEKGVLMEIWVDETDMPTIIGHQGRTLMSLRLIMKMIGYNQGMKLGIKLYQNE